MTTTRIIVCVGVLLELQLQRISLSNDTENLDGDHGPFVSDTNYTPLIALLINLTFFSRPFLTSWTLGSKVTFLSNVNNIIICHHNYFNVKMDWG